MPWESDGPLPGDDDWNLEPDEAEMQRRLVGDLPTPDVVPPRGMSRADILRANARAGTYVEGTVPGEIVYDADGVPVGVGDSEPFAGKFSELTVTQRQLDDVGLTREEVPHVRVIG